MDKNRRRVRADLAGVILGLALHGTGHATPPTGPPATGDIAGTVVDQSAAPVKGAKISIKPQLDSSARGEHVTYGDSEGRFRVAGLAPGSFTVLVTAINSMSVSRTARVKAGRTTTVNVVIDEPPRVSTRSVQIKEVYDDEFADNLAVDPRTAVDTYVASSSASHDQDGTLNTEAYEHVTEGGFRATVKYPLSTFAIDVDTASYSNVRRFIEQGRRPPAAAVRIEELVNYFPYAYPPPTDGSPFAVSFEVNQCPWNADARLVRVGLRGKDMPVGDRPPANLVFLIDVSGSMDEPRKLPLVQDSLRLLVGELRPQDRVAITVYAGSSGLVLPSTVATDKTRILGAIDRLSAGGSTNGAEGIRLAYQVARGVFIHGGNNRVILATDGDFNVGVTSQDELVRLIEGEAKTGVFLTVLGFGTGNLKDATMEKLADKGNGSYAYIDSLREARKVLVEQMAGTLLTIAKDVKIQVEMNPARVAAYRLIGYENRSLAARDFNDDAKDGGEIGAGHTVTALYEILPPGAAAARALAAVARVDALKYAAPAAPSLGLANGAAELFTFKLRWKEPDADQSRKLEWPVVDSGARAPQASTDFRFVAAVIGFGFLLRDSPLRGTATWEMVARLAADSLGPDPGGHRREFLRLLQRVRDLDLAGHITISRDGRRDVSLAVAPGPSGLRIEGVVRGVAVAVEVHGVEIRGRIGVDPVFMWMHGDEADGRIGGREVGFVLVDTPGGHLLRGTAVGHTVRLERSFGRLSWLPECERALLPLPRGPAAATTYQGTCASGQRMRVSVPDAFDELPPLPRSILLALLLTERPEVDSAGATRLFPATEVTP